MNKIAIVTGGSRGLGRSMALHLAERGVDVIFTYRAAEAEASEVRERIRGLGRKAVALPLDVADSASFDRFAASIGAESSSTVLKARQLCSAASLSAFARSRSTIATSSDSGIWLNTLT